MSVNVSMEGVKIRELSRFTDERGWLIELYRHDEIMAGEFPVMSYISMTKPGVARGPHEHVNQTDIFCFIGPSTFRLYLWDNRKESATFGEHVTIEGGEDHPITAIVPPGVVHAYKNIGLHDGIVFNAPNQLYAGKGKQSTVDEIRHEDNPETKFKIED